MDLSSLPDYPTFPRSASANCAEKIDQSVLSPRMRRRLWDFAFLVAIIMLLCWLRWMTTQIKHSSVPPRPPLEFELIKKNRKKVRLQLSREQVEELLGPPSNRVFPEADLQKCLEHAEHSHRHLGIPQNRVWDTWSDPKDEDKWIAVLYADGKAYWDAKVYSICTSPLIREGAR